MVIPMFANRLSRAAEGHLNALRDAADADYLLARIAFRFELDPSFIWLAQQAVEKYLKLALVFHGGSAAGLLHHLEPAAERLEALDELSFSLPDRGRNLIQYLDRRHDRYAERSYYVSTDRLVDLDACVWLLRKYCSNVRGNREKPLQVSEEFVQAQLKLRADFNDIPNNFWLTGGLLDEVRRSDSPLRRHLRWQNLYFSHRKTVTTEPRRHRAVRSSIAAFPRIVAELQDRLVFTKEAKERARSV
jgi:HEPN domain-containing protein